MGSFFDKLYRKKIVPILAIGFLYCCHHLPASFVDGAFSQNDESRYLANFDRIMASSYSQVDDLSDENEINKPPQALIQQCKSRGYVNPTRTVTVNSNGNNRGVTSSVTQIQCGEDTICVIPNGMTLRMDGNLNVGALIVRGTLLWSTQTQSSRDQFLCGGYLVVENDGSFEMDLSDPSTTKRGWLYIKNNGAIHPQLLSRSFGTFKERDNDQENPTMEIRGRHLERTWSLLSEPLHPGSTQMTLLHDPIAMGWTVGDRLGISPTDRLATGWGQTVWIVGIASSLNDGSDGNNSNNRILTLSEPIQHYHQADFKFVGNDNSPPAALMSAEVVNLSRNVIITGDDFEHVDCVPNLPEAVVGEETSVLGCRCSYSLGRTKCTMGLHHMQKFGGVTKIENARVEKCGQRGVEGKYCLHLHKAESCPDCVFRGNAIENGQQRGIVVHGTHNSVLEDNVLYNVRGGNVYVEDGNEMWNSFRYNVAICPFPFRDDVFGGCTIPGTSNRIADSSDNQSGFFSRAGSNNYVGNRASNHFNGMFLAEGSVGRGEAYGKVCESSARLGRMDGNAWHSNGRFGTYTLGFNYPKVTDQTVSSNGYNTDQTLCKPFDPETGETRGLPGSFVNHLDYGNAFVGHYSAGDLQHRGHYSFDNNNLVYWKETKNFENGCGSHISNGYYSKGIMRLPDQATFVIENTIIADDTTLNANHHCNVGTTGVLCMATYVLHKVKWKNQNRDRKWIEFQSKSSQDHNADQNHGGIFTLSPIDATTVRAGGMVDDSLFPEGFISLVSNKYPYLLDLPNNLCVDSGIEYGNLYDNGILCRTELRALKIYTRGLLSGNAPQLKVEFWLNSNGIGGQTGDPDSSQLIGFHQIGADNASKKQGYSVPVIPGIGHSYKISLTNGPLPADWVIEFSDPVIGNRWSEDEILLSVAGRTCGNGGLVSSQHDRKFIWGGNLHSGYLDDKAWFNHGACVGSERQPPNEPPIDCGFLEDTNGNRNLAPMDNVPLQESAGIIEVTQCLKKCQGGCDSNSYCDCGSESCQCKAGFFGSNCEINICSAASCGEHGSCSARYLGGVLPVSKKACICEGTWMGDQCDRNPCVEMDINCSGNGECVAVSETKATCMCQDGYFGALCEERSPCEGFCENGSFPYFGCALDIPDKVALGCLESGGCYYRSEGEEYPFDGFCTYKTYGDNVIFSLDDFTPTPPGVLLDITPEVKPNFTPSPDITPEITPAPDNSPGVKPIEKFQCGCEECTEAVWNTVVDGFSCGDRISFLEKSDESTLIGIGITTGPLDFEGACRFVSEEFPETCTCSCNDSSPAPEVTPEDTPVEQFRCGCDKCTEAVWNTVVHGFSCGDRISFLEESDDSTLFSIGIVTGPFDMEGACHFVSDEFPETCTCSCTDSPPTGAPVQCNYIKKKKKCNKENGCSWAKKKCKKALSTESCKDFSKKRKCKKRGCIWRKNKKKCEGRWIFPSR